MKTISVLAKLAIDYLNSEQEDLASLNAMKDLLSDSAPEKWGQDKLKEIIDIRKFGGKRGRNKIVTALKKLLK